MTQHPIGMRVLAALRGGATTVKQIAKDSYCSDAGAAAMLEEWLSGDCVSKSGTKFGITDTGTARLQAWEASRGPVPLTRDL